MTGLRSIGWLLSAAMAVGVPAWSWGGDAPELPLVLEDHFEQGAERWEPTDPAVWKLAEGREGHVYSLFAQSNYEPPHRSPLNFALLKDAEVGDFVLDVKVKSTVADYAHRDICLVFGYQNPAHFYYVHFGKRTDDHANQIFIVDGAPRTKISTITTDGTNWDDEWHDVRIVRRVEDGQIEVYFDDLKTPIMTATDKKFTRGRVGLGSFDDTGDFDDFVLHADLK